MQKLRVQEEFRNFSDNLDLDIDYSEIDWNIEYEVRRKRVKQLCQRPEFKPDFTVQDGKKRNMEKIFLQKSVTAIWVTFRQILPEKKFGKGSE